MVGNLQQVEISWLKESQLADNFISAGETRKWMERSPMQRGQGGSGGGVYNTGAATQGPK